jgi:sugar phosphate isomerase/epimerase
VRVGLGGGGGTAPDIVHLSYCSNIHPGESWAQTLANVRGPITAVKAAVSPRQPFGVGLRLSAAAADELAVPAELDAFAAELEALGLYVFTINGFPHGAFHQTVVKQTVYRPDWSQPERLRYTLALAGILDRLLPEGVDGSISTVPGGFRPETKTPETRTRITEQLVDCAVELWRRSEAGGSSISLALEPEPCCMLETTAEALEFFERHLFGAEALARVGKCCGLRRSEAETLLRQHLGLCLDTCHAAVEFEDPTQLLASVRASGVRIAKVQVTSGLRVAPVTAENIEALRAFADRVYLHQVVAKHGGELLRYLDLPDAIAAFEQGQRASEWRVHYHVPVFEPKLQPFGNTQDVFEPLLAGVIADRLCAHLEVETYTWSVLPAMYRELSMTDAIVRELRWVLERLQPDECGA